jgi:hypothetical protein
VTNAVVARERGDALPAGEPSVGWYFYGITRGGLPANALAEADEEGPAAGGAPPRAQGGEPLQLLEGGGLVAVVRPVAIAEHDRSALEERLRQAPELEAMVCSHHRVIEAIHARQSILPARLGTIYAGPGDIVESLRTGRESLFRQLERLDGCDEWAVHLFADRATVRERVTAVDAELRRLREAHAGATPGRAFFLERQLRDRVESAARDATVSLAQQAFDRLRRDAVAGEIASAGEGDASGEEEILRASFLVRRDEAEHFLQELRASTVTDDGVRCEWSGPWPPYSFAGVHAEDAP